MTDTQFKTIADQLEDLKRVRLEDRQEMRDMRAEMKPVVDTFNTLRTVGKWIAILVAFAGSLTALGLGVKNLFKR